MNPIIKTVVATARNTPRDVLQSDQEPCPGGIVEMATPIALSPQDTAARARAFARFLMPGGSSSPNPMPRKLDVKSTG